MLRIGSFVWGVRDMDRGIAFWSQALGFELREPPSHDWAMLVPPDRSGMQFGLQLVSSPAAKRHHLDLYCDDWDGEVERLIGLGATRIDDWDYEEDADYVVLADPEGNPFCVLLLPELRP